jgi:hypothetical protein
MDGSEHNQYSPAGEVDRWADLAQGLTHNGSGRRRALRMLVGLAAVVVLALVVILILAWSGLLS